MFKPLTARARALCICALFACCAHAQAQPQPQTPFNAPDFTGTYDCKGHDKIDGPYTGTITLTLVPAQSTGPYGSYDFKLEVPGMGTYPGEAAAHGLDMAVHFANANTSASANTNAETHDFGTGIARFKHGLDGKWTFHKFNYQPQFKGGNHGKEECVQR
ncbi:MAG TPA: hypothetical protein VGN52_03700 [Burkholderiales bacterium]